MLFTNEIVFRGHPDKVADQISDAILSEYLKLDPNSRVAVETLGGKGIIVVSGEVSSKAEPNIYEIVERVLKDVGYDTNYTIINNIGVQSQDISMGVDVGGAGDQGVMFGYATPTGKHIPYTQEILQEFSKFYDRLRRMDSRFLPDGKAQITAYYDKGDFTKPIRIKDVLVSYQNTEKYRYETDEILKYWFLENLDVEVENFIFNPTGKFEIGGFEGDVGLTGRKIIVDTYHGFARHGGGAFSGKDLTKVDRSGAYIAREIAIDQSKKHGKPVEVQLSYGIGIEYPLSLWSSVEGDLTSNVDYMELCKVSNLVERYKSLDFEKLSRFGHFGGETWFYQ